MVVGPLYGVMADEQVPGGEAAEERTLLDQIIFRGKIARDTTQRDYARDLVLEFVNDVFRHSALPNLHWSVPVRLQMSAMPSVPAPPDL